MNKVGYIHSVESCGTVDGPGIRYVIFFQGCPLRCQYCHNPDTWKVQDGKKTTVEELMKEILSYTSYMKFSGGGITATGGEPALQMEFVTELFKACKAENIHTALDTSGFFDIEKAEELLKYTDLILLDIKQIHKDKHQILTGVSNEKILKNAQIFSEKKIPLWIRHVVVPGLSDDLEDIETLAQFLSSLKSVEAVEILPFHKMGEYKWEVLGLTYSLSDTQPPPEEKLLKIKSIFEKYNLPVRL